MASKKNGGGAAVADPIVKELGRVVELDPTTKVSGHPKNPRPAEELRPEHLSMLELRAQIRVQGQLVPALVRPVNGEHQVVLGHRRRVACAAEGLPLRAFVVELSDDAAELLIASENPSHLPADPFAEAELIADLLARSGWSFQTIADQLGKTVRWVALRARLPKLSLEVRDRLEELNVNWPIEWLAEIAVLEPETQEAFARREFAYSDYVADLEDLRRKIGNFTRELGKAPWASDDALLVPAAGACSACPKTTARQPELFPDEDPKAPASARCLDNTCWKKKLDAHAAREIATKRADHPNAVLVLDQRHDWKGDPKNDPELPESLKDEKVLRAHEVEFVSKKTLGAVPAVLVGSDRQGTMKYVVPEKTAASSKKKAVDKAKADDDPAERLAQSKATIERRRKKWVIEAIATAVREAKKPPAHEIVRGLVAALEVERPRDGSNFPVTIHSVADWKKLYAHGAKVEKWDLEVWRRVREALAQVVVGGFEVDPSKQLDLARHVGETVLELNVAKLLDEAREEIPDPKWWAGHQDKMRGATKRAKRDHAKAAAGDKDDAEDEPPAAVEWVTHFKIITETPTRIACGIGYASGVFNSTNPEAVTCTACRVAGRLAGQTIHLPGAAGRQSTLCGAPLPAIINPDGVDVNCDACRAKAEPIHWMRDDGKLVCGAKLEDAVTGVRRSVNLLEDVTCVSCKAIAASEKPNRTKLARAKKTTSGTCRGCKRTAGEIKPDEWADASWTLCARCGGDQPKGKPKPARGTRAART